MHQISQNTQDVSNLHWTELVKYEENSGETIPTNMDCQLVYTGTFTGRTPENRFIVAESSVVDSVDWNDINVPMHENHFWTLYSNVISHLSRTRTYETNVFSGSLKSHQFPVKFYTEKLWQSHFCRNMFVEAPEGELFHEQFTVYNASSYFEDNWESLGLNSPTFIVFNIKEKIGLIAGTEYGGEMKKGIFSMLNYLYPKQGILTMHCGAKVKNNQTSLFFGLSGTGKTTLSSTPNSLLIGDDEHAWTAGGVFNLEGGCYAKTAHLDADKEPLIFKAIHSNALIENVSCDHGEVDFDDLSLTPNGRVSYSLDHIPNLWDQTKIAPHPSKIFLLTCDTLGVLPPVSILSHEEAAYQFLAGYTAKVSGTELGIKEPKLVFSACYGAPFMTLSPLEYTRILYKKLRQNNIECFLINTGWVNGSYSEGSDRIPIKYSRAIIDWCENDYDSSSPIQESICQLKVPEYIEGIPHRILNPFQNQSHKDNFPAKIKQLRKAYQAATSKYLSELAEYNLGFLKDFFWQA